MDDETKTYKFLNFINKELMKDYKKPHVYQFFEKFRHWHTIFNQVYCKMND